MMHLVRSRHDRGLNPRHRPGTLRTGEEFDHGLGNQPRIVHIATTTLTGELLRDGLHPGMRVIADHELTEDDDSLRWQARYATSKAQNLRPSL
jgi:hypothetical protein